MMTTVPFSKARTRLTDLVNEVFYTGKRVVLTRKGKKIVAIVSLRDFEILETSKKSIKTKRSET